jgi:hypothetical protein
LVVEGLTTLVMPALNAVAPVVDGAVLEVVVLPPLLQALITSAASAATTVAAYVLRLFMW